MSRHGNCASSIAKRNLEEIIARRSIALLIIPLLAGISGIAHSTSARAEESSFADRIHPSADMRLRYESDSDRLNGKNWRQRGRIRVRVGATADIAEGVVAPMWTGPRSLFQACICWEARWHMAAR